MGYNYHFKPPSSSSSPVDILDSGENWELYVDRRLAGLSGIFSFQFDHSTEEIEEEQRRRGSDAKGEQYWLMS